MDFLYYQHDKWRISLRIPIVYLLFGQPKQLVLSFLLKLKTKQNIVQSLVQTTWNVVVHLMQ